MNKKKISELAIFNGNKIFTTFKSTSNLLKPDINKFLNYSKSFYQARQYTNNGPNVKLLEKRLAKFHHTKHCVTFSSGFWALALAAKVLSIKGRTEIIMPSLTYRRMTDMAVWAGLKPHFCEVDGSTLAMTVNTVEECINKNTALILAVHPIVNCCESKALVELARANHIPILFDSVESVYESIAEGKIGEFGDAECFSLHACKLFNGFGGGYLTTNDDELARQLASMRTFGFVNKDSVEVLDGLNAKLNEMHASMALASLDDIDTQVLANKARYLTYLEYLEPLQGVRLLKFDQNFDSGFKNIVIELTKDWPFNRNDTVQLLNAENILARAHYSPPLHQKKMSYDFVQTNLLKTESIANRYINLPCGQQVTIDDIVKIVDFLFFIYQHSIQIKQKMSKRQYRHG